MGGDSHLEDDCHLRLGEVDWQGAGAAPLRGVGIALIFKTLCVEGCGYGRFWLVLGEGWALQFVIPVYHRI